jgi:putative DNA topoisomerase
MKTIIILLIAVSASFSTFAQSGKHKTSSKSEAVKYTCTMDPEVISNKPGKCPKCGMELTKVKTYTCTMHPEVVSNQPGTCPKCGMELTEVKAKTKGKKS